MKQLELNFKKDKTPEFQDWLQQTNKEHRQHGEKEYSISEGMSVFMYLKRIDFFNGTKNNWNRG